MHSPQKIIDLDRTLFELTEAFPELIAIFQDVGLSGVSNPVMRKTAGRTVKISEGIKRHKLSLADVTARLEQEGFVVKKGDMR